MKSLLIYFTLFLSALAKETRYGIGDSSHDRTGYFNVPKYDIDVFVFRNGGNNTEYGKKAFVKIDVNTVTTDFDYFKQRAGVKLNVIPRDCTEWSPTRPRRPWAALTMEPDPEREPDPDCSYESYSTRMAVFDNLGRQVHNLYHAQDGEILYLVEAGDHFMWHGGYVGRDIELPYAKLPDGTPIRLVTLSLEPRVFMIPRFVTDEEADKIVESARTRLVDSLGFDGGKNIKVEERTSQQTWLDCNEFPYICDLDERIAETIRVPIRHVELHSDSMQVVHYDAGEHYHSHYDWFDPTLHPNVEGLKEGYNRMLTLLYYLDDVEEGGGTVFPVAGDDGYPLTNVNYSDCSRGLYVQPKKGRAILWYNLLPYGNNHEAAPDPLTVHGGCDPIKGEKWAANKWVYNKNWRVRNQRDTWRHRLLHPTESGVLSPLEGSTMIDVDRASRRSDSSDVTIELKNVGSDDLTIYWVNPDDLSRVKMVDMQAGEYSSLNSYVGHRFVSVPTSSPETAAATSQHIVKADKFQYEFT